MKTLYFITVIFFIQACQLHSQQKTEELSFLEGVWKINDKETYEAWKKNDKGELTGKSYKIKDGKEYINEHLSIKEKNGQLIYTATVLNQNEGKGIDFVLNKDIKGKYSFENLAHDFPKKIIYHKVEKNQLKVDVLGENNRGFSMQFKKQ
ncbi:hypothetical protein GTQ40_08740 [Flavobacteriaceae bacterium R38]|nr:hypothetical protein [Flavobacteriaceae bacterium R38]